MVLRGLLLAGDQWEQRQDGQGLRTTQEQAFALDHAAKSKTSTH